MRQHSFRQKEVSEGWRVEELEVELQPALLPETGVVPARQINLFARLAERNITPGRAKTECAGGRWDKIFELESFSTVGWLSSPLPAAAQAQR